MPPALLGAAGLGKTSKEISEFVRLCGGCVLGGGGRGTEPSSSLGTTLRHPRLEQQDEINILVHGQSGRAGFVRESAKVQELFRGLPEPENKLALMRLLDRIQF